VFIVGFSCLRRRKPVRDDTKIGERQAKRGKKRPLGDILTLDDLDQTIWEHSRMITQLKARFKAAKERSKEKPNQKPDDFS
jgi:hypothetical protein